MTTVAQHQKNRTRKDIIVRRLVTFFGCSVLVTLLVLIWHLFSQTFPMFLSPSLSFKQSFSFTYSELVSAGDLLDGEPLIVQQSPCQLSFIDTLARNQLPQSVTRPCSHTLRIIEDRDLRWLIDISGTGLFRASPVDANTLLNNGELNDAGVSFALPETFWQRKSDFEVAIAPPHFAVKLSDESMHYIVWHNSENASLGQNLQLSAEQDVLLLPELQKAVAYSDNRFVLIGQSGDVESAHSTELPINWMMTIEHNRSIYIATGSEQLSRWVLKNDAGTFRFAKTFTLNLQQDESPLTIQAHANSNAGLLLTNQNRLLVFNRTTGETLHTLSLSAMPLDVSWLGNRVYVFFPNKIAVYELQNLAGINTLKSLFQPAWYEGYGSPEYIYQTSTGSDFHEAKYALVPLLMGSIKAALAALVLAIPLSLGAAIYTGYFAGAKTRNRIKPMIEMIEAIPSVVIGFIAAIVLVPLAEHVLFGVGVFLFTSPILLAALLVGLSFYQNRAGVIACLLDERLLCSLILVGWGAVCYFAGDAIASTQPLEGLSTTSLVIGLAMGVAISPTIYALAEDAIYSVPPSLKNASFALGATPLETLIRIVLRVATPGLIAAVMLGFGRAIGETMIILMVSGNTPIPEWSMFESIRALTANIAIELPEAEVGSALYTVLFFTASALFVFTFIFNTLAEILRHKMRQQVKHA